MKKKGVIIALVIVIVVIIGIYIITLLPRPTLTPTVKLEDVQIAEIKGFSKKMIDGDVKL